MIKHFIPPAQAAGRASTTIRNANPLPNNLRTIGGVINELMLYALIIGGLILLVMIIYAGFTMLTSLDNPEKADAGKKILTTSLAGFFLLFTAYWIAQALEVILGIPILGN